MNHTTAPFRTFSLRTQDGLAKLALRHYEASSSTREKPGTAAVVFVHGFAGNQEESGLFPALASRLALSGIHAVTYDARGLGASTGCYINASLDDHVLDFQDVHKNVSTLLEIESTAIGAIGFSLGATVIGLALRKGLAAGSIAFLSPAARPRKSMWPRYDTPEVRDSINRWGYFTKPDNGMVIGSKILRDLQMVDLGSEWYRMEQPLLVCHGSADQRIPISHTEDVLATCDLENVRYRRIDGASHSFQPASRYRWRVCREVSSWFTNRQIAGACMTAEAKA